jgi:hypothetical protein
MSFSYASRENSSFVPMQARPYLDCVKKEMTTKRKMTVKNVKYLSPEELYALERWAHRERSRVMGELIRRGAVALKTRIVRAAASLHAFARRGPSARIVSRHAVNHV